MLCQIRILPFGDKSIVHQEGIEPFESVNPQGVVFSNISQGLDDVGKLHQAGQVE